MFQLHGFTSRPVRYAIVATHAFRTALEELSVDEKIEQLAAKVAELQERLEAIDETSTDEQMAEPSGDSSQPKAKTKRGTTTRKPRAKSKK